MSVSSNSEPPAKFTPEGYPESAYTKAKEEWDSRIGNARAQAFNWRLACLISLFIILVLAIGLIFQSAKSTVTPYVIEVDSSTGMARAIGPAREGTYSPKEEEIKHFIAEFVLKTRTVPLDPVVYKNNWLAAYAFMTNDAANKMNNIMQKENQASLLGRQTVQPIIVSIMPLSQNSYQVRWKEEIYSLDGGKKEMLPMTGMFTIVFGKPKDEKELLLNPLGIYLQDISWAKDL